MKPHFFQPLVAVSGPERKIVVSDWCTYIDRPIKEATEADFCQGKHDAPLHHEHAYKSTGCLHGAHDYCQGKIGHMGSKEPSKCKFCPAKCVCECHDGDAS